MRPLLFFFFALLSTTVLAQNQILITNVNIFNGRDEKVVKGNVLIEGNLISKISTSPIPTNKSANVTIIDGKGKFLMPGLIDAHVHTMMESIPLQVAMMSDIGYINLVAANAARKQLLRGFTTVRDLGGASFSLKTAIDAGMFDGPRIFPSGATICCFINMWGHVIQTNSVHCYIGRVYIKPTCINHRNFTPRGNCSRCNIFPIFTSVFSDMNKSIIGTCP